MRALVPLAPCHFAAAVAQFGQKHDVAHAGCLVRRRTEIIGAGKVRFRPQLLGEREVACEGLEHMLPGTKSLGAPDRKRLTRAPGPYRVGDEAILRPVAAADD